MKKTILNPITLILMSLQLDPENMRNQLKRAGFAMPKRETADGKKAA